MSSGQLWHDVPWAPHTVPHTLGPTSESLPWGRVSTAPVPTPYNGNSARARPALVDVRRQPSDTSRHWQGRCARPGTSQPTLHIDPTHRHRGRTWDCSAPMNRARPRPRPTGPPPRRQRPQNLPPRRAGTPRRVTLPPQTSQRDETRQQDGARRRDEARRQDGARQRDRAVPPPRLTSPRARQPPPGPRPRPRAENGSIPPCRPRSSVAATVAYVRRSVWRPCRLQNDAPNVVSSATTSTVGGRSASSSCRSSSSSWRCGWPSSSSLPGPLQRSTCSPWPCSWRCWAGSSIPGGCGPA